MVRSTRYMFPRHECPTDPVVVKIHKFAPDPVVVKIYQFDADPSVVEIYKALVPKARHSWGTDQVVV